MNHRKATPAKGTRFNAIATVWESVVIQAPESSGSAGTERRSSQSIVSRRTEKTMPAIAPPFGVFRRARARAILSDIIRLRRWKQRAPHRIRTNPNLLRFRAIGGGRSEEPIAQHASRGLYC